MQRAEIVWEITAWYAAHARDLPWRTTGATPWAVMVSEFMLQQTPVVRVLEPWRQWLERWPTPAALAATEPGEAVRAWGRLGYPRRALRLHAAATAIVSEHGGDVPRDLTALRALPGVGEYTAAAIASFAFGQRHVVLDTNVRRVLARLENGRAAPSPSLTAAERAQAERWLPDDPATAARWAVAAMELGAQLCAATSPNCAACPVSEHCRWLAAGRPDNAPVRRPQGYAGTDRQARGALLAVLREAPDPVAEKRLLAAWTMDPEQARRALDSLVADRLIQNLPPDHYQL